MWTGERWSLQQRARASQSKGLARSRGTVLCGETAPGPPVDRLRVRPAGKASSHRTFRATMHEG
jgi:hypothetical protein